METIMSDAFTADEVFRIAEQIEINGVEFYSAASQRFSDPAAKKLLAELADMERGHQKLFESMRAELAGRFNPDPEGEAMQYLRALAAGRVFVPAARKPVVSGKETLADLLRTAVQAEKDSVTFYLGIASMLQAPRHREQVNKIIAEEMRHVTMLSSQLAKTPGAEKWSNAE
jgi:rubrerythrin